MDFGPARSFWTTDGGSADDRVPPVDPADLRSVLAIGQASSRSVATGIGIFASVCSPSADIMAVWYRAAILQLLLEQADLLSRWVHNGECDGAVFKVAAKFPMKKLGVGVVHQGFPLDVEEFVKQIGQEGTNICVEK